MKYPEYINGIKQVQNPVHRFVIKTWYSEWFRLLIVLGVPYVPMLTYFSCKYNWGADLSKTVVLGSYILGWIFGLSINDWSNLRRIGLTEYHRKIKEKQN